MQDNKKKIIFMAIGKAIKRLRGNKSQYMLGAEYDIPSSVLSDLERGVKDPQLTTIFKIANAFNIKVSDFIKEVEIELPKDFSIDEE